MSFASAWIDAMRTALADDARVRQRLAELRAVRPECAIVGRGTICRLDDAGRLEFTADALTYLGEADTERIVTWFRDTFREPAC